MSYNPKPVLNNPVKKHMEDFNKPKTEVVKKKYRRNPKHHRPVHEIDPRDPYLGEEDIWRE